jgi:NTP pyrophosphatase (non-canonical NTP hydrolase)
MDGIETINELVKQAHDNAVEHGWWEEDRNFGELLALIHSEASEVLEDYRNHKGFNEIYYECKKSSYDVDDKSLCFFDHKCDSCQYGKPCGIPTELADIVIRVFDLCGRYGIGLEEAIKIKMAYNKTRPYRHGGKKA